MYKEREGTNGRHTFAVCPRCNRRQVKQSVRVEPPGVCQEVVVSTSLILLNRSIFKSLLTRGKKNTSRILLNRSISKSLLTRFRAMG